MKAIFSFLIFSILYINLHGQTIELELFASGFSSPVDITNAGDDRLFVVERSGVVKIVESDGNVLPNPFMDIDSIVGNASGQSERGLLGLTFHPDYSNNGFLFVHYTDNNGNSNIVRYQVNPNDPNVIDGLSRKLIIEIDQPFSNHNGGCLKFSPDGYLYIGMGDGGSGNDPINAGQSTDTYLGKMLRLDVDNGLPYTIPTDNPFVNDADVLDEIWALGLRNPWRFSFDSETGDMWIGDVGQNAWEEIDFQPADSEGGENYGWRCYEANTFTNLTSMNDCQENFVNPVFEAQHQGFSGPCSITGGFVYRGSQFADLVGKYICADYCSGDFYMIAPDGQGGWEGNEVAQFSHAVSTFGEDSEGELYMASFSSGGIYRVMGEPVGTENLIPNLENVQIYPNPTDGRTQLDIKTKGLLELNLQLVDMQGKVLLSKSITVNGLHKEMLEMDGFPSGSYILNITSDKGLLSKQLITY